MIIKTNIAGINTKVDTDNKRLIKNLEAFRYDFRGEPLAVAKVTDLELRNFCDRYVGYDQDQAKSRLLAENFFCLLPEFDGIGLKAATVSIGDKTYVVAGESQHDRLKYIGELLSCGSGVSVIDDTYSIIRRLDDKYFVYATPWATKVHGNTKKEINAVLLPGDCESIRKAERKEILDRMILCLTLPKRSEQLGKMIAKVEEMEAKVPVLCVPMKDAGAVYQMWEL